jgi:hypothetical protein
VQVTVQVREDPPVMGRALRSTRPWALRNNAQQVVGRIAFATRRERSVPAPAVCRLPPSAVRCPPQSRKSAENGGQHSAP